MTTDRFGRKLIPCGLCGKPTPMLGTKRCDGCWELETRIQADPVLARRILGVSAERSSAIADEIDALLLGRLKTGAEGVWYCCVDQRPCPKEEGCSAQERVKALEAELRRVRDALRASPSSERRWSDQEIAEWLEQTVPYRCGTDPMLMLSPSKIATAKCQTCGHDTVEWGFFAAVLMCRQCVERGYLLAPDWIKASPSYERSSDGVWMILYEDKGVEHEVFVGAGAEEAARKRFAVARGSWSCCLLAEVQRTPIDRSAKLSNDEPVAWVPIHPKTGPLWASTVASLDSDRPAHYEVKPLYFAPRRSE